MKFKELENCEVIGDNVLIKGDCLEVMDRLIELGVKVDAIITDPPYEKTRGRWDNLIPFDKMWERVDKLIKPKGAVVLFGNEPFSSALRMSNINEYKYDIKWVKNRATGFANCNYRPMNKYEDILIFSKANASTGGKKNSMCYHPQGLIQSGKKKKNTSKRHGLIQNDTNNVGLNNKLMQDGSEYVQKFTNYPSNIAEFSVDSNYLHPTMKPLALIEYLIKTYTNEGETVLDFTSGSFTTSVASIRTNRKSIGIELDEGYYNIGVNRVKEEVKTNLRRN